MHKFLKERIGAKYWSHLFLNSKIHMSASECFNPYSEIDILYLEKTCVGSLSCVNLLLILTPVSELRFMLWVICRHLIILAFVFKLSVCSQKR